MFNNWSSDDTFWTVVSLIALVCIGIIWYIIRTADKKLGMDYMDPQPAPVASVDISPLCKYIFRHPAGHIVQTIPIHPTDQGIYEAADAALDYHVQHPFYKIAIVPFKQQIFPDVIWYSLQEFKEGTRYRKVNLKKCKEQN
jgi:hypothetical protein